MLPYYLLKAFTGEEAALPPLVRMAEYAPVEQRRDIAMRYFKGCGQVADAVKLHHGFCIHLSRLLQANGINQFRGECYGLYLEEYTEP